jgi:hypothetical protein
MSLRSVYVCLVTCAALLLLDRIEARRTDLWPVPGARVHLHAHNAYPDTGRWVDRIDRALASGAPHLAVEQDLVWVPPSGGHPGRSVVAHDVPATGHEPTLDDHFFERVRPMMDAALREGREEAWPLVVLHLDFKTNEPDHHRYVWSLLGRHAAWLTTAARTPPGAAPSALQKGPLLVLTEHGDGQERDFHLAHPVGSRLRLFGTVPPIETPLPEDGAIRDAALAAIPPDQLMPSAATSYRRWTNHSWGVIERGGPRGAGPWTAADAARLRTVVTRAHDLGLWVRFYGLNGHDAPGEGWSAGYNFGTLEAARLRWRAAIALGVDFIASDQYEALAGELRAGPRPPLRH